MFDIETENMLNKTLIFTFDWSIQLNQKIYIDTHHSGKILAD